ncbi:hypothetical protein Curi_c27480 [Gottschalkia acidurici 9a]|uniref:Uncharacterized protein n=1 Tax=Gottschalkia acidurici (strain ATCC 7906 / DSM 604 / BCRC 14475 / CIP 104303 / KCTC 5404 / NCIMB 10678 / 9a) TaxID=1128398 RepID=K0B5B8_GOTA9|nr:ABC transporter permease [Gottschalkia acidurici]AFS79741.1 hypothetical protein Curi_c27480 [Gottschalkia acidurici 9a]
MFFIFLSLLETFLILAVSSIVKINIGLEMIFYHFLSSIVVSFILIVIQVFLSLRFEKQVIGIGVSLFGAFLSFSFSRLPKFITRLIPWCLYTELSPSRMIGIDGVAHYYEKSGNLNIHLIYICIYLILFFILRNIYGKHNY